LRDRPEAERQQWARWVLGSHSDQFLPEMIAAANDMDRLDPVAYGKPILNPGPRPDDLLVITSERGKHCLIWDQPLPCRVVLFDFTGDGFDEESNPNGFETFSAPCRGKGEVLEYVWKKISLPEDNHYIGVIDDDVVLRSSDIFTMLAMARIHELTAVQPSVPMNTVLSSEYGFLRQRPSISLHRVPFVEVLAPFLRVDLFKLTMVFGQGILSSYGLDRFAYPLCAAHLNCWKFAAIDLTPLEHIRPLQTLQKKYSNGLMSKEEELLVRQRLMLAMGFEVDKEVNRKLENSVLHGSRND
jgi:hypothetical protein